MLQYKIGVFVWFELPALEEIMLHLCSIIKVCLVSHDYANYDTLMC